VQGYALGGGQSLAVTSDITVATDDARFGYPEVRYGQLGGGGHVWNWFMGAKKTKEYLFTGRTFGAQEALMFGLVNQVVPASQLDEYVMRLARDAVAIEQRNPGYLQANKFQINQRHLDLMHSPQVNPAEVEQVPREMEFLSRSKSGQEEFYRDVATSGFDAAMEKLHGTYSSKK
jgi:enoyl-CoA hydratase/carnithine racemase